MYVVICTPLAATLNKVLKSDRPAARSVRALCLP